ncbi:coiled-coil domain-containing protein 102A-like isoform X2 [Bolinopsis microptera]|uniref:coiled-coil domain-containing protein 102A-like isoform X2 n=1 Tax=Bolinopsis microptera TaxID=2820187 RepID=UPI003079721C
MSSSENNSYIPNQPAAKAEPYATPQNIPDELLSKLSEPVKTEIVRWDDGRFREIDELRNRALQMEKTMKWWSDCTANWREKWGKVRAERNKAREQCKHLQSKVETLLKECSSLRLDKEEIRADYTRAIEELALVKGVPLSSIESKRRSRASNDHIDIDSSYAPSDEQGSEPSLKSELHFIEDVLKSTEHHYGESRAQSVCSDALPVRDTRGHITGWKNDDRVDRRMSQPGTRMEQEDRLGGVDLSKLKQLLEETQRHLHEERNSKIALSQSAELYNKENSVLKKKMEEYKRQRTEALEEVSRIQLESGDKLARLSLEIEGENESHAESDRKIKDMRADVFVKARVFTTLKVGLLYHLHIFPKIQRLQAENATEWAKRERIETEKSSLERENKNLKLQIQEAEETIARRNTNPLASPEYKTLQADIYERNKELEMLKTAHTRVKKQLSEKTGELDHCQKRLEVIEDEVYNLRKRVEDLKKELAQREDEVDMRNNQIRKLQRTSDELSEHNDTLQTQLNTLESRLRQRTDAMYDTTERRLFEKFLLPKFNPAQRRQLAADVSDEEFDEE